MATRNSRSRNVSTSSPKEMSRRRSASTAKPAKRNVNILESRPSKRHRTANGKEDVFDDDAGGGGEGANGGGAVGDGFDDIPGSQVTLVSTSDSVAELTLLKDRVERVEGLLEKTIHELVTLKSTPNLLAPIKKASENFIKINVGGTVFTTRKSTLMRVDGTYLSAIASGSFEDERDVDGNVYIDRDPKYFQYILNWLRDPSAPQEWPQSDQGLLHELMFFGIKDEIVKGSIYVAYGFDGIGRLSTIECYNPMHRAWNKVAEFKFELSSPACAEMGGKMYITGGKNAKNRAVPTVAYFDPYYKEITLTSDLNIARFGHGLVMLDNYIYAVGGYGDDGGRVASVERYSEKTRKWESIHPLLNVRSALGCDALRGKIYVAGGYGPGTTTNQLVSSVEMYDPQVKHWVTVAPLKTPRAHVCCVTYQGKLWAVGGYDGHQASHVVEIYDPDTNMWTDGPSLRKKRSVVVCTVLGDTLYAIGGYDGQNYLSCAEMYDPERKVWTTGPEMQVARGRHCVCTLPF